MVNAACCVLVSDDRGGVECTVAWTGGNDKDIPVRGFIFFSPSHIPPRSNHPVSLDVCERCVCQGNQLFTKLPHIKHLEPSYTD